MNVLMLSTTIGNTVAQKLMDPLNLDYLDLLIKYFGVDNAFRHYFVSMVIGCDQEEADLIRDKVFMDVSYGLKNGGPMLVVSGNLLEWKNTIQSKNTPPEFAMKTYGKFAQIPRFLREVRCSGANTNA